MKKTNEMQAVSLPEVFTFNPNNAQIRVQVINDEPWFVAKDICGVLGLNNVSQALTSLDIDEKRGVIINDVIGRNQEVRAVNESGLYSLIFQSRKPEAKSFRKWVTSEVLPAIRKTGKYGGYRSPRSGEFLDLRSQSYEFRQINDSQVRVIDYEDVDWYNVNDITRGIGVATPSNQIAKQLNSGERQLAIKILIYGNTHPTWFTPITGVKLILSGSRKIKNNKQSIPQLQLTIGGLV